MICGHGHEQKLKYPYPRDSKIIQMSYPRAKAIDQNPALCKYLENEKKVFQKEKCQYSRL